MVTFDAPRRTRVLLVAGVLLSGFSLRPAVTSVGALLPALRQSLPLSGATAGVLTALPTVCFAGLGLLAPRLARRTGPEAVLAGALLLLGFGVGARALAGGPVAFLAGSVAALTGVAAANVVGAPLVRRHFPERAGLMTGLYATSIAAGVALPAATSVPIADLVGGPQGWRVGLAVWAPVAVLAALPWLAPAVRRAVADSGADSAARVTEGAPGPPRTTIVALSVYFGLQSLGGFVVMGWLPAIFVDAGLPGPLAGLLLAATAALAVPFALLVPVLADRPRARPLLVVGVSAAGVGGWTGVLLDPTGAPWLCVALLASLHCAYPLAIALVRVRSAGPDAELRLSAIVQTGGYTLAAAGPLTTGVLRDATDGWTVPLTVVIGVLLVQTAAGLVAVLSGGPGPDRRVDRADATSTPVTDRPPDRRSTVVPQSVDSTR